ncbi:MAG: META domain-containing protein [Gemmatimonadota bacterium]
MNAHARLARLAIAAVVMTVCSPGSSRSEDAPDNPSVDSARNVESAESAGPAGSSASRPELIGSWTLVRLGEGSNAATPVAGTSPGLELEEAGRVSVVTGCNGFGGTWTADEPGALVFAELVGTLRACEEPIMAQEAAIREALEATRAYRVEGDTLRLTDSAGVVVMVLARGATGV